MTWKNNITDKSEIDTDELAARFVTELTGGDIVFDGEEWWLDETNDPREVIVSYQCGSKEEPIYAKQIKVRVTIEVVEVPNEVTIIE